MAITKTTEVRSQVSFTQDDREFIDATVGLYSLRIIARRLHTTEAVLTHYCQNFNISCYEKRHKNGLTIFTLSKLLGVQHNQIAYWIKRCNMPIQQIKLPKQYNLGKKMYKLIDDSKLDEWYRSGYALSQSFNPACDIQKQRITHARNILCADWVPITALKDIVYMCAPTINRWMRVGIMPKPVFQYKSKYYCNRTEIAEFVKRDFGIKAKWDIEAYDWRSSYDF